MDTLDDPLLRRLLAFLGNAKDFRSCEKTSKAFQAVLKDDKVWRFCKECKPEEYPDHPYLNRELALIPNTLEQIKTRQKMSASVILHVLQMSGWTALVSAVIAELLPTKLKKYNFDIRGDTSAVLLEIVGKNLHQKLRRAKFLSIHRSACADDENGKRLVSRFPTVIVKDFQCQDALTFPENDPTMEQQMLSNTKFWETEVHLWNQLIDDGETYLGVNRAFRDEMATSLALQAGIPKMDYGMCRLIWASMIKLARDLLEPPCYLLAYDVDSRVLRRSYVGPNQPPAALPKRAIPAHVQGRRIDIIRKIPPLPRLEMGKCCPLCRRIPVVHTLVPYHVEDTAKMLGITPNKVICNDWHIPDTDHNGVDPECLITKSTSDAMSYYTFDGEGGEDIELPIDIEHTFILLGDINPYPPIDAESDSDDDETYEDDELEEDSDDEFLVDDIEDEPPILNDDASDCSHPAGFVDCANLPNIIL